MIFDELNKTDWEAMASYLSGEMEETDAKSFEERIYSSEKNQIYFEQVNSDWNKMEHLKDKKGFDTDKAWNKLYLKMEEDGLLDTKIRQKSFSINRWAKIAAIFIIGLLLSTFAYYIISDKEKLNWQVVDTYEDTGIKQFELPDGSVVYLNANSKLYYPDKFEGNARTVEFEGDGFFEITKNPQKPFIIKAKGAEIKVLGTSFNVNTKGNDDDVEVLVETGKVQLSVAKNKTENKILTQGEMGLLINDKVTKKQNTDVNYLSWKTRNFYFEDVKLSEAIKILSRAYNVNINYDEHKIGNKKLESKFYDKPIDTILEIICNLEQLKYIKEGNNITLIEK